MKTRKCFQVDEIEAKLWAEIRGLPLFQTSALSGTGITDMFHAFFSQIVRIHDEGGGLPKTPTSARKVRLDKSASSASVQLAKAAPATNGHASTPLKEETNSSSSSTAPQPSPEQASVMSRLRGGRDPWQQLGVSRGCGKDEVNRVYRRTAMLLHPDKTAVQGADEAFKLLGLARRSILRALGVLV